MQGPALQLASMDSRQRCNRNRTTNTGITPHSCAPPMHVCRWSLRGCKAGRAWPAWTRLRCWMQCLRSHTALARSACHPHPRPQLPKAVRHRARRHTAGKHHAVQAARQHRLGGCMRHVCRHGGGRHVICGIEPHMRRACALCLALTCMLLACVMSPALRLCVCRGAHHAKTCP